MAMSNPIVVFSKPWRDNLDIVAARFSELGAAGFELPIRPGYTVTPDNCRTALAETARMLESQGQRIYSVAADPGAEIIAACADAGVDMIRYCIPIDMSIGYAASLERFRRLYAELERDLAATGVKIGVQNHSRYFVGSAIGLMAAIRDLEHTSAVLDFAHCAVAGEPHDMAWDIAASRVSMVNIKGVVQNKVGASPEKGTEWEIEWLPGRQGILPWPQTVSHLRAVNYRGPICLSPDYGSASKGRLGGDAVWTALADDLDFLKFHMAAA